MTKRQRIAIGMMNHASPTLPISIGLCQEYRSRHDASSASPNADDARSINQSTSVAAAAGLPLPHMGGC